VPNIVRARRAGLELPALSRLVRQPYGGERRGELAADRKGQPRPVLVLGPADANPTSHSQFGCGAPGARVSSTACLTTSLRRKSYGFPALESWVLKSETYSSPVRRLYQSLCDSSPTLGS
jgi:hypothetical protein